MRLLFICCIFFAVNFSNALVGDWIDSLFKADYVWHCADGSRTYMFSENGKASYLRVSAEDIKALNAMAVQAGHSPFFEVDFPRPV
jgi:hypothetical protein